MARRTRSATLETRAAREKLARRGRPYWFDVRAGLHLGYRRNKLDGAWVIRLYDAESSSYVTNTLDGVADDREDANGDTVLSFEQALDRAVARLAEQRTKDSGEAVHVGPFRVRDAMTTYEAMQRTEGKKGLAATMRVVSKHILPKLGGRSVTDLTAKAIATWRDEIANSKPQMRAKADSTNYRDVAGDDDWKRRRRATANRCLTVLKAALNLAFAEGKVSSDIAWRRVKPFRKVDVSRARYLTPAEARRLINAMDAEFRPMVEAALLTGCRYGELCALRIGDFHPSAGTLSIKTSKSGDARHVVLTDEGRMFFSAMAAGKDRAALILTRNDGTPWKPSDQIRRVADAVAAAKLTDVSFHILRHTYASLSVMAGVPLTVVAQQLGHADDRMTRKHYAHLAPSFVADMIRKGAPSFGIRAGGVTNIAR